MTIQHANPRERAFDTLLARDKLRLWDPATGLYLHLSGQGMTCGTAWAWLGFLHQANTLRKRARTRGDDWPFVPVHRSRVEPVKMGENDG